MKKDILSRLLSMTLALAVVVFASSCDEDEIGLAPTITLSEESTQNTPGATVTATLAINAPNGAKTLVIAGVDADDVTFAGEKTLEETVDITIPNNAVVGSTITVVFTVIDNENLSSQPVEFSITVGDPTVVIQGDITVNTTLDANIKYLLKGKVYVQSGATLTIPAGTKIFGDKITQATLIINRGAKIDARGTAANPIIMTSAGEPGFRNRGDWGGVVILGRAYTNGSASSTIEGISASGSENGLYGPGTNAAADNDNSGIMTYVRIEFAGIPLSQDNELNSLTMGSVGSGTQIDHIQVSYGNDDAYEWFGGSVNHKYLVAYSTIDDDFDTDRGYNGNVQFGLVVRDPAVADFSGARAWESSSNNTADVAALPAHGITARHSAPTFSNITILGPRLFRAAASINGFFQAALEINTSSSIKVYNSIITGFPTGARWNAAGAQATVSGNLFAANGANTAVSGGSVLPTDFATVNNEVGDVTTIFGPYSSGSLYSLTGLGVNPLQAAGSPGLSGFVSPGASFETVTYRGGFGTTADANWNYTSGWINFDPINAVY
jgi:hypothetical protein